MPERHPSIKSAPHFDLGIALMREAVSPEIAEARDARLKAMKEAEAGWLRAQDKIAERATLARGANTRR